MFERLTNTFLPFRCFSASPSVISEDTAVDTMEWSSPSRSANSDMDAGFLSSLNIASVVAFGILGKYDKLLYKCCWHYWTYWLVVELLALLRHDLRRKYKQSVRCIRLFLAHFRAPMQRE